MYNGKFVSYKQIIEDIYRDFKFQYVFQTGDAIEWLGSALRKLKIPRYYVDKLTDGNKDLNHQDYIIIENYRGKLPCDLYSITQTARAIACDDFDCDSSTNCAPTLNGISYVDFETGEACTTGDGTSLCAGFVLSTCTSCSNTNDCCTCDKKYTYVPMRWNTNTFYKGMHNCILDYNCCSDFTYTVNNNYIFTNFESGKVCMSYKAVPIDEEGYPLIPDNESVIDYVKWFIAEKIAFQLFITDKYTEKKYEYFASNLQLYFRKARNEGRMPSNLDESQGHINQRIKAIKFPFEHGSFFGNMTFPEYKYNHPRHI